MYVCVFMKCDVRWCLLKCWAFYLHAAIIANMLKALELIVVCQSLRTRQSQVNNLKLYISNLHKYLHQLYFSFPELSVRRKQADTHSLTAQQGSGKLIRALRPERLLRAHAYTHTHTLTSPRREETPARQKSRIANTHLYNMKSGQQSAGWKFQKVLNSICREKGRETDTHTEEPITKNEKHSSRHHAV